MKIKKPTTLDVVGFCFKNVLYQPFTFLSGSGFWSKPLFRNKGSILGSAPRKRLYKTIGSSVPPFSNMFSRNNLAFSGLNKVVVLNASKASVSKTPAYI